DLAAGPAATDRLQRGHEEERVAQGTAPHDQDALRRAGGGPGRDRFGHGGRWRQRRADGAWQAARDRPHILACGTARRPTLVAHMRATARAATLRSQPDRRAGQPDSLHRLWGMATLLRPRTSTRRSGPICAWSAAGTVGPRRLA